MCTDIRIYNFIEMMYHLVILAISTQIDHLHDFCNKLWILVNREDLAELVWLQA